MKYTMKNVFPRESNFPKFELCIITVPPNDYLSGVYKSLNTCRTN